MPRCPNCFYELVLLEKRRKYKCAKCSKLFPQKEIDANEFKGFSKREKILDKERTEKDIQEMKELVKQLKPKLSEKEKKIREKKYRKKNSEKYNRIAREYWAKHKERLTKERSERYYKNHTINLVQQKVYRENNKVLRQINALRWQQKEITLQILENEPEKLCTIEI